MKLPCGCSYQLNIFDHPLCIIHLTGVVGELLHPHHHCLQTVKELARVSD